MKKIMVFLVFLFSVNLSASPLWPKKDIVPKEKSPEVLTTKRIYFKLIFNFYHFGISPNDFSACGFNPTCSYFGKESVEKYGLIGIFMATDRLMRDNFWNYLGDYPKINGKLIDKPDWHYLPNYWRLTNENIDIILPYR